MLVTAERRGKVGRFVFEEDLAPAVVEVTLCIADGKKRFLQSLDFREHVGAIIRGNDEDAVRLVVGAADDPLRRRSKIVSRGVVEAC